MLLRVFMLLTLMFALQATPARAQSDACTSVRVRIETIGPAQAGRFDEVSAACLADLASLVVTRADQLANSRAFEAAERLITEYVAAAPTVIHPRLATQGRQFGTWAAQTQLPLQAAPPVKHLFTHSLIVDPTLAFDRDYDSRGYDDWMLTTREFLAILTELHRRNFVLVDVMDALELRQDGRVGVRALQLPAGKKPLIWSFDDVNYYKYMQGDGFAERLQFDRNRLNPVMARYRERDGSIRLGDFDAMPIVEQFVTDHPDFSWQGAKGIIAVTGYEGVLGYRTDGGRNLSQVAEAKLVAEGLKSLGWRFASHSFGHPLGWFNKGASLAAVRNDVAQWRAQVQPIVGETLLFVGPFGTIWDDGSARRAAVLAGGFKVLFSVDATGPLRSAGSHAVMGRLNVDGFRMKRTPRLLAPYFDPASVVDPGRP